MAFPSPPLATDHGRRSFDHGGDEGVAVPGVGFLERAQAPQQHAQEPLLQFLGVLLAKAGAVDEFANLAADDAAREPVGDDLVVSDHAFSPPTAREELWATTTGAKTQSGGHASGRPDRRRPQVPPLGGQRNVW
jgi:hypothetical protein